MAAHRATVRGQPFGRSKEGHATDAASSTRKGTRGRRTRAGAVPLMVSRFLRIEQAVCDWRSTVL